MRQGLDATRVGAPGHRRNTRVLAGAGRRDLAQRAFDLAFALLALLLLSPVFVICALAIVADSRGPVLYRGRRVGRHGVEFDMLKFRKMHADAAGPRLTSARDDRFTRVGRVLAQWKLDELPQLLNVLRGQMSIVGPRPEDPEFVALAGAAFAPVLAVRPGITGLSQIAFASESEILDREDDRIECYVRSVLPQKLALDGLYAERRSLLVDVRAVAWTIFAVALRRDVAVHRGTVKLNVRRRPNSAPKRAAAATETV
jgi:lipopolysaccharide/colanic/teichoic acid biosynthesis glycosyltransferase